MERSEFESTFKNGEVYRVRFAPIEAWTGDLDGHPAVSDSKGRTVDVHVLAAVVAGTAVTAQAQYVDGAADEVGLEIRFGAVRPEFATVDAARVADATPVRRVAFGEPDELPDFSVWLVDGAGALVSGERALARSELRCLADELAEHLGLELTPRAPTCRVGDEVPWDALEVGCLYFDRGTCGAAYGVRLEDGVAWIWNEDDAALNPDFRWITSVDALRPTADSERALVVAVGLRTREDVRRAVAEHRLRLAAV